MHGNDAAAHAHGQVELEDPIESLLDDPGATPLASPENSASELPDDLLAETESMNPPPNSSQSINPPSRRNRSNLPPLTAAEMALDSPSPPPAYESTPAQAQAVNGLGHPWATHAPTGLGAGMDRKGWKNTQV
jgi:hypothetical protein